MPFKVPWLLPLTSKPVSKVVSVAEFKTFVIGGFVGALLASTICFFGMVGVVRSVKEEAVQSRVLIYKNKAYTVDDLGTGCE
jgi:hypothetical protein